MDRPRDPTTPTRTPRDWAAIAWGAATGAVLLAVAATTNAVLDQEVAGYDDSGWELPLFLLVLVAYALAGAVAARRAVPTGPADAPLTHGALAGVGAFVIWIPVRVLIWLVRDEHRSLVGGSDAALRPGQVFGQLVIATGLGMLGATLANRRRAQRPD